MWKKNEFKIKKISDLVVYINNSNADFLVKIKDNGGTTLWFRALLTQILWLTFLYQIGILLIPIKEFLYKNILIVGLLMAFNLIWRALKDNVPYWIDDFLKGGVYYKCDNIKILNQILLAFFAINVGVLFFNYKMKEVKK